MNRKISYLRGLAGLLVLLMAAPPWVLAQGSGTGPTFRQEELDQMLAPIALYPDSLLGQMLVAATFPDQVAEADEWVRQNKELQGDALNAALDSMSWDLSVKALVPFPQVLSMMSDKKDWTQRLGDAFMAQQTDVMDSIQRLRAKAHAAGNLNTTEQQKVVVRGNSIAIAPANPQFVYVPTYNPAEIYGSWWNPAYPPFAYNPYYPNYAYDPAYTGLNFVTAGLFGFAAGIAVGSFWHSGWGHWDWGRRRVNVNIHRTININRNDLRRRDIRTSNWHDFNRQRRMRSGGEGVGQSRRVRTSERAALRTGGRPRANSVQQGAQQRGSSAQVRQSRRAGQVGQARTRSDRGQVGRNRSAGKSRGNSHRGGISNRRGNNSQVGGGSQGNQ